MAVSIAERGVQVKPHRMPDDNRPETVSTVRDFQLSRQPTRPLAVEASRYPGNTHHGAILSCFRAHPLSVIIPVTVMQLGFDPMSSARDEASDPS